MRVGEKIKFIRTLRGMTQKELGLKVGFSASTADNRIRQYEIGKMKPKEDKLELIADALNVPVEALSDIDIGPGGGNALFYLLFDLERTEGLQVKKIGDQFVLAFDQNHPLGDYYNEGLSSWYYAKKKYFSDEEAFNNDENVRDYQIWTQEYPDNVIKEEETVSEQIKQLHGTAIEHAKKNFSIKTVSEYIQIIENMLRCGISLKISKNNLLSGLGKLCVRIRLPHKELLELDNTDAIESYARFMALIRYLESVDQDMDILTSSFDNISYDEYNISSSLLATALLTTGVWIQEQLAAGMLDDPDVQMEYKDAMRQFNIPIKDAIMQI